MVEPLSNYILCLFTFLEYFLSHQCLILVIVSGETILGLCVCMSFFQVTMAVISFKVSIDNETDLLKSVCRQ